MAAVIIILLLVVVGAVVAALSFAGVIGVSRAGGSGSTHTTDPDLRYPVPSGVDPAVVIDALKREGYDATEAEDEQHQPVVNIRGEGRVDRETVRTTLQRVPFREGDEPAAATVRFSDE